MKVRMGFYLELAKDPVKSEYREMSIPPVYWALYVFAGFALVCMGLSAHSLFLELYRSNFWGDRALIWGCLLMLPLYVAVGVKMAGFRKFISWGSGELHIGFRVFGKPMWVSRVSRAGIIRVEIAHLRSSPNVGKGEHTDSQYHNRGHWRVVLTTSSQTITLDRSTDAGALEGLYREMDRWVKDASS